MSLKLLYYTLLRNVFFQAFKLFSSIEASLYRNHVKYHKIVQGMQYGA